MSLALRQIGGTFVGEVDAVNLADDHDDPETVSYTHLTLPTKA